MHWITETQRQTLISCFRQSLSVRQTADVAHVSGNTVMSWNKAFRRGECRCGKPMDHLADCGRRPMTADLKARMIDMRVRTDATTAEIATKFNTPLMTVYAALAGYPKKRKERKPTLGVSWSADEITALRQHWPMASQADIQAELPGRAWASIQRKASNLGIARHPDAGLRIADDVDPIFRQLRALRIEKKLTTTSVAEQADGPCTRGERLNRQVITQCELGLRTCTVRQLRRWATALGATLSLTSVVRLTVPASEVVSKPRQPPVAPPTRVLPYREPPRFKPASQPTRGSLANDQVAIEEFLRTKGATKLPNSREMAAVDPLAALVWDRGKHKWVRQVNLPPRR